MSMTKERLLTAETWRLNSAMSRLQELGESAEKIALLVSLSAQHVGNRIRGHRGPTTHRINGRHVDELRVLVVLLSPAATSWAAVAKTVGCHFTVAPKICRHMRIKRYCEDVIFPTNLKIAAQKKRRLWLQQILAFAQELGHTPSSTEYHNLRPDLSNKIQGLGGIKRAHRLAGINLKPGFPMLERPVRERSNLPSAAA
jgi:hypothetical protein